MGGGNYKKLAIPGSYINVMDFKTVKQLAEYLQYLDKNNTAYNEYFKWRKMYKVSGWPDRLFCHICGMFDPDNPPKTKVYDDLTTSWVKEAQRNQKDRLATNLWKS